MSANSLQTYEGLGITLLILTSGLVAARCVVAWQLNRRRLGADDWCSIIGLGLLIATYAVNHVVIQETSRPPQSIDLVYLQKISVGIIIATQGTLWFSKAPIIILYLKLFGVHTWLRYTSWAILVISFIVYLVGLIYTLVNCPVDSSKATFPLYERCANANTLAGVFSGFISVVADITLFALPFPVILALKIENSKKIGLGLTFFTAIMGIVASVVALYYKWRALYGAKTDLTVPIICFTVECTVALVVGCAPALRSFWVMHVNKSITKSPSRLSRATYRRSSGTADSRPAGWERDDEHINPAGRNNAYVRMEHL